MNREEEQVCKINRKVNSKIWVTGVAESGVVMDLGVTLINLKLNIIEFGEEITQDISYFL